MKIVPTGEEGIGLVVEETDDEGKKDQHYGRPFMRNPFGDSSDLSKRKAVFELSDVSGHDLSLASGAGFEFWRVDRKLAGEGTLYL